MTTGVHLVAGVLAGMLTLMAAAATEGRADSVAVPGQTSARTYRIDATHSTASSDPRTILVFHEWWGLNDYVKCEAARLYDSLDGAVTIVAVDLYDGAVATTPKDAVALMQGTSEVRARAIIDAVVASCGPKARIGTIGWYYGGARSLQAALAATDRTTACVMYYGMPERDVARLRTLRLARPLHRQYGGSIVPASHA